MVAGEKVLHFENRYRHKDGSWRVLSWRSMPQPDGLMYATARDVTELKAAEQELQDANEQLEARVRERTAELAQANESLQHSERRFRALIEHGSDGIALIDAGQPHPVREPDGQRRGRLHARGAGRPLRHREHPSRTTCRWCSRIVEQLMANPGKPVPVLWRRRHKNGDGCGSRACHQSARRSGRRRHRHELPRRHAAQGARSAPAGATHAPRAAEPDHPRHRRAPGRAAASSRSWCERSKSSCRWISRCICLYDAASHDQLTVVSVGAQQPAARHAHWADAGTSQHSPSTQNGLSRCVRGRAGLRAGHRSGAVRRFRSGLAAGGLRSMVAAPLLVESKVFGVLVVARRAGATASAAANANSCAS